MFYISLTFILIFDLGRFMVIKVIERKNLAFDLRVSLCLNGDSLRFSVRD